MKKLMIILCLLVFVVLAPLIYAKTSYNQSGSDGNAYQLGSGIFNAGLETTDITTKTLSDGRNIPLVSDLDGDGENEIIAIDSSDIRIYTSSDLDVKEGYDLVSTERVSNMIAYDIDDDNLTELIIGLEVQKVIHIIEHNGTNTYLQEVINMSFYYTDPMFNIQCCAPNKCMVASPLDRTPTGNSFFRVVTFNSTDDIDEDNSDTSDNTEAICNPFIRHITCADYDESDGTTEFILSRMKFDYNGNDEIGIFYYEVSDAGAITVEQSITATLCGADSINPYTTGIQPQCSSELTAYFTPPLVYDVDEGTTGKETIVGMNIDNDEFKMCGWKASGGFLDDYPETFDADGRIIGNVMVASVWPDIGTDFCVLGYEAVDDVVDLLCANERDVDPAPLTNTREFKYSTADVYNITGDNTETWNMIAHSGQHSSATTTIGSDTGNLHEIISSYGIFSINWDDLYEGLSTYSLDLIWENPNEDGVLISVDAEQINIEGGSEDLLFMTNTNFYYYDDGRSNTEATITEYTINPCLDSTWKINTTVGITITVEDPDSDQVSARAVLYEGSTNEQDGGWKGNYSSGTEISFDPDFIANSTIGNGNILLQGYDAENQDDVDEIELLFSVGANGVEYGDCTTTVEVSPAVSEIEGTACSSDDDCGDGFICVSAVCTQIASSLAVEELDEFAGQFGLSKTIFYIFVMFAFALGVWFAPVSRHRDSLMDSAGARMGAMLIIEFFMVIIGVYFDLISLGVLLSIVIVSLIGAGIWLARRFTTTTGG